MKKQFVIYALALCALFGCKDNSSLYGLLTDYDARITTLERLCSELNTNISSLQTIVEAQQTGDYITSITPIKENGVVIGYTITFAKNDSITIYHGQNGKDGKDGTNGINGTNGTNGVDGHTPIIGVAKDTDGVYYWTLDGEWLLDNNGQKLRVTGKDGKDGIDGQNGQDGTNGTNGTNGTDGTNGTNGADGQDGISPQLKIEADYWWISYDNGATWTQLGKAKGDKGDNGTNGTDGQDGDSMFQSVTQDEDNVYFTLENGTLITLSKSTGVSNHLSKENGHYYVDLGLPSGTMWATCNIGGYAPGDYGDYYDFGAIEPMTATTTTFIINDVAISAGESIAGSQYDVATQNWGGRWQIPTLAMWYELTNNCTKRHTTAKNEYDVNIDGILYVSNINGKSIFIPLDVIPTTGQSNSQVKYNYYGYYHSSIVNAVNTSTYSFSRVIVSYQQYWHYYMAGVAETIGLTTDTQYTNHGTYLMIRPVFHP